MTELKERLRAEGNSEKEVLTSSLSIKERIRRLQGIIQPNENDQETIHEGVAAAVREEISSTKKTTEFQELTNELHELKSQKTELEKKLSGEQEKGNEYKESLDKKTTEFQELKNELKSQKKELEKKLSGEQEKGNEYKESLDKKTKELQELRDELHELKSQKTKLEEELVGYQTSQSYQEAIEKEDQLSTPINIGNYFNLVVAANIGTEGGELEIPGTKCSINIPPKALRQQEDITVRIVPPETWLEESKSFASNSFSIIELLPNNLKLDKPAKVQIPHCLQIAKREKPEVEIYISHHEENCQPHWEKSTEHKYKLEDDVCTVYTSSFCWIKVEIDDQIVEAKKIQVFATVPTITPKDSRSVFTIGYYLDLPGFTNGMEPIEKKYFLFKKEKKQPLSIVLKKTVPKFWNNQPPSSPQEIPFSDIELSKDICCKFPLLKSRSCRGIPLCMFTVSQGKREITLSVRPPISSS